MKKVYDYFYTNGIKGLHWTGVSFIIVLSIGIGYIITNEYGIIWGILTTIGIFSFFIWKIHVNDAETKRRREFVEHKYGNDPDWTKYKELKKKFNGA